MKTVDLIFCFMVSMSAIISAQQNDFPKLNGHYFGQKLPGEIPVVFAAELGLKTTQFAFSPDGNELYYGSDSGIMYSKYENGQWTKPQTVPFSGKYLDFDFNFSPDGNKLFFVSNRPLSQEGEAQKQFDIWVVDRTEAGWTEPENIGSPINSEENEIFPSISQKGNFYFCRATREGANIYCAKLTADKFTEPKKLGDEINSPFPDLDPFVAPDDSYLIFHSYREGGFGGADLYISFRNIDGTWSRALNMGEPINTEADDYCAKVSIDGKFISFERLTQQPRKSESVWVSTEIIRKLRLKQFPDQQKVHL